MTHFLSIRAPTDESPPGPECAVPIRWPCAASRAPLAERRQRFRCASPARHLRDAVARSVLPTVAGMSRLLPALAAAGALVLGSAVIGGSASVASPFRPEPPASHQPTTNRPLVLAHRGASGYRPEHTVAAYELAARHGCRLHRARSGDDQGRRPRRPSRAEISGTTDVADHQEFARPAGPRSCSTASRQRAGSPRTSPSPSCGRCAPRSGCRSCARRTRCTTAATRSRRSPRTIALREKLSREYGRTIGIIPEIKHSTYFHDKGF